MKRGVPRGADDATVGLSTLGKAPPGPPFCPRAGNVAVHTNGLFATIERAKAGGWQVAACNKNADVAFPGGPSECGGRPGHPRALTRVSPVFSPK